MIWLVDDAHLGRVIRGQTSAHIGRDDHVATTGLWYVRLCQAVSDRDRAGALSGPFGALGPEQRARALAQVLVLPERIDLPSLRVLGPIIGGLRSRHTLNLLAIEAVAAAVHLEARVLLSTSSSPRLEEALAIEERPVVVDRS
ncbi:MAG TPA: hypothetical protein VK507_24555 [Iamia sp.]|nr:hypothetical protein [Iamia sp.]